MEGADCETNKSEVPKSVDSELVDSGCEQSPTTPSPTYLKLELTTYDREFLLGLQFSPLALNPNAEELLWPDYDNSMPSGIFHPTQCYYKQDDKQSEQLGRRAMSSEYFKPMLDSTAVDPLTALRPQRKSFVSGCQMRTSISEVNEKPITPTKTSAAGQRRTSESKDRPRSVPTVERNDRRVGSGRIILERAESRPDSRNQPRPDSRGAYPSGREKPSRPHTHADKKDNWRHRGTDNEDSVSHREIRDVREDPRNAKDHRSAYHNNGYNSKRYRQDAEPEWFTEDVSTSDTIELKGFDGHKEKIEKREKREREKKERKAVKGTSVKDELKAGTGNSESSEDGKSENISENQHATSSSISDLEKAENIFDFNSFMENIVEPPTLDGTSSDGQANDSSSSRFSRWFSQDNQRSSQPFSTTPKQAQYSNNTEAPAEHVFTDELHVDAHMSSLVKDLLSPGGGNDHHGTLMETSPAKDRQASSRLLHMLQNSSATQAVASSTPASRANNHKQEQNSKNELPSVLSKLLSTSLPNGATNSHKKPVLPTEFKTLEELEADLQPTVPTVEKSKPPKPHQRRQQSSDSAHPAGDRNQQRAPASLGQSAPPPQEMAAYHKLVGMLQVSGQLDKAVPKMPEVTNTQTPSHMKKALHEQIDPSEGGSPILPPARNRPPATHSNLSHQANVDPHMPQMRLTPSNLGVSSSAANMPAMMPNPLLHTVFGGAGAPGNLINMQPVMQQPAQPINFAAPMHSSAFHGPVNPLIQHAMHQRQKLSSPILFSKQPPVHIVAPAAIHPAMGQFPPMIGQQSQNTGSMPIIGQQSQNGGSMPIIGQNSGSMPIIGQNSGSMPIIGQNSGSMPIIGQNSGSMPIIGQNSGSMPIIGQNSGSMPIIGQQSQNTGMMTAQQLQNNGSVMGHPNHQQQNISHQTLHDQLVASGPAAMSKPSPAATSMSFTPTSVIRRRVSDKVDERQRVSDNQAYNAASAANSQQQLAANMRAQQQHQAHQQAQQQAQQQQQMHKQQQMNMRPIVKSSSPSVAEQFFARHLAIEQQNQSALRQAAQQQAAQQQAAQQQAAQQNVFPQQKMHPQQANSMYAQMNNSSNMYQQPHQSPAFSKHHALNTPQGSQQVHSSAPAPSVSPLHSLQQQLVFFQSQQQNHQQPRGGGPDKTSDNNISKWFCAAELVGQQNIPLPKHATMLKLEDIEH